jgi:hypothetical protein
MVGTGYHDPEVWKSVLFQLHQAVYILHQKGICLYDFSLEHNVFIKDTNYDNNNTGYWRYRMHGIDFFIPNYGAVLVLDTSFQDLSVDQKQIDEIKTLVKTDKLRELRRDLEIFDVRKKDLEAILKKILTPAEKTRTETQLAELELAIKEKELESEKLYLKIRDTEKVFHHKIMMKDFFKDNEYYSNRIDQRNKKLFKENIFSRNKFTDKATKKFGGIPADESILKMIEKIGNFENLETTKDAESDIAKARVSLATAEAAFAAATAMSEASTSDKLAKEAAISKAAKDRVKYTDELEKATVRLGPHNDINNMIINHGHYLHNRVGTPLNESEKKNMDDTIKDKFIPGMLVGYIRDGSNYYVAIYKKKIDDQAEIIDIKRDLNKKVLEVNILKVNFSEINIINEQIKQEYRPNMKLSDDELLESYEYDSEILKL